LAAGRRTSRRFGSSHATARAVPLPACSTAVAPDSVGATMLAAGAAGARAPRCVVSRVCKPLAAGAQPRARALVGASLRCAASHSPVARSRVTWRARDRPRRRERAPRNDVAAPSRCVHRAGARRGGAQASEGRGTALSMQRARV
jgi:hypothetical protein